MKGRQYDDQLSQELWDRKRGEAMTDHERKEWLTVDELQAEVDDYTGGYEMLPPRQLPRRTWLGWPWLGSVALILGIALIWGWAS